MQVWAWGDNAWGQCAQQTEVVPTPTEIAGLIGTGCLAAGRTSHPLIAIQKAFHSKITQLRCADAFAKVETVLRLLRIAKKRKGTVFWPSRIAKKERKKGDFVDFRVCF